MFNAIQKRLRKDDRGFTLIELMVVVLIIAILIAIAIPTFLGARTKAQDRATQADLRQGVLTAKTYYTDNETFLSGLDMASTAAAYKALEPSLKWVGGDPAVDTTEIGVVVADGTRVVIVKESRSNEWFCIEDSETGPTEFGRGASAAAVNTALLCTGGW